MNRQEQEEKEILEEIIETIRDNPEIDTINGESFEELQFGIKVDVSAFVMYVFNLREIIQKRKNKEAREFEVEDFWEHVLNSSQRQMVKEKLGIK